MNKHIPNGFKKMDLILTFKNEEVDAIENKILYFLVRDFYIFYSKIPKFDGREWTEFHFYCRPKDEVSIAYRIGTYASHILKFYNRKDYFDNGSHRVPDNFPECIYIPAKYDSDHRLCVGDKIYTNGEAPLLVSEEGT